MSEDVGTYQGSCLCGAVHYSFSGSFERFFLCHCSRCRKGTGSAHASNMFFAGAELTWLSGGDMVQTYAVEGTRHSRSFCRQCGTPLPQILGGDRLKLPAGSLDSATDRRPLAHIWTASRADWDDHLETVPGFPDRPG